MTVAARGDADPEQVLGLVDLAWAAPAMPDQLSEGARKLVGVARALAGGPRLCASTSPVLDSTRAKARNSAVLCAS